ncbi:MAG: hypothetical protein K8F91_26435 [Candidatus Obscuribacterales bacterium]|nr:hypothetical protein [Candidatus Obscuribacterales bacterium]
MDSDLDERLTQLSQKVDDQFRFTRNVLVLCTLTIIGVMVFTVTQIFNSLPSQIILNYMSNLDQIVAEWKACEFVQEHRARQTKEKTQKKAKDAETKNAPDWEPLAQ